MFFLKVLAQIDSQKGPLLGKNSSKYYQKHWIIHHYFLFICLLNLNTNRSVSFLNTNWWLLKQFAKNCMSNFFTKWKQNISERNWIVSAHDAAWIVFIDSIKKLQWNEMFDHEWLYLF